MSFYDLRKNLGFLDFQGEVLKIEKEVDPEWEVGAICREKFYRDGHLTTFLQITANFSL